MNVLDDAFIDHTLTQAAIDFETTDLDPINCAILEFAMILLTPDLKVIAEFGNRVLGASEEKLDRMDDYVRNMHTENGLLDLVRESTLTVAELEVEALAWLATHDHHEHDSPHERTLILLGSSCRLDLNAIDAQMPRLARALHYRMADVSGIREALRRWVPELILPDTSFLEAFGPGEEVVGHRALSDIRLTIAEARNIRSSVRIGTPPV